MPPAHLRALTLTQQEVFMTSVERPLFQHREKGFFSSLVPHFALQKIKLSAIGPDTSSLCTQSNVPQ